VSMTPESAPRPPQPHHGPGPYGSPQQYGQFASGPQASRPLPMNPGPAPQPYAAVRPPQDLAPYGNAPLARVPSVAPTGLAMKRRNPVAAWLGLPLVTLGIYHLVWYYKIHREMAEFDRRRQVPVAGPMLVLLFLSWTVVAPLVSYFNTGNRIADAQRAAGQQPTCSAWIGLVLCFFFGLQTLYYQIELNKIVDAYGVPAGSTVALAV
jgi:hypothetical protein